jgi:hypothetical protein
MKREGPRRDPHKRRFWQRAVAKWRRSAGSIPEYCRERALSAPSFRAWRRELTRRGHSSPTASRTTCQAPNRQPTPRTGRTTASFLPVHAVEGSPAETAERQVGGVEILLAAGPTKGTLSDKPLSPAPLLEGEGSRAFTPTLSRRARGLFVLTRPSREERGDRRLRCCKRPSA